MYVCVCSLFYNCMNPLSDTAEELAALQAALRDASTDPRYSAELSMLKALPGAQPVVCEIAASPLGARNLLRAVHEHRAVAFVGGVLARQSAATAAATATGGPLADAPDPCSRADAVLGGRGRGGLRGGC